MTTIDPNQTENQVTVPGLAIKVFGVGGAGINLVEQMLKTGMGDVRFAVLNTDDRSLAKSTAPEKISLENRLLRGLGTGGDPDLGRVAVEEQAAVLKKLCTGLDVVFIVTGLGGGTGTGGSPLLAQVAREAGALVLAFVTLPFDCEGARRQAQARLGLEQLKAAADGVICLPNQKVFKLIDANTSVIETFNITNELLADGVRGIWRLLTRTGLIDIHFADLCAVVRGRHAESCFATAEATGTNRAREVVEKLLAHPMLEDGHTLGEAGAILVSVTGGHDLTMAEVNRVMEQIAQQCEHAEVTLGAAIDEAFAGRLAVTLVATNRHELEAAENRLAATQAEEQDNARDAATAAGLETPFLDSSRTSRPPSRLIAPPPSPTPEAVDQLLKRKGAGSSRQRRTAAKMRQCQLPLEIVSKGRFDKSEPTIHNGEDLDIPTYIRRGMALN